VATGAVKFGGARRAARSGGFTHGTGRRSRAARGVICDHILGRR
jgi:hypothetical protein